jgi:acyl carrier protein
VAAAGTGEEPDLTHRDAVSAAALRNLAAEIFEVRPNEITDGAAFYEDLGIDSVQKVEFVVRIERQLGVRLTDEEAAGLRDFGDTLAVLRNRGVSVGP